MDELHPFISMIDLTTIDMTDMGAALTSAAKDCEDQASTMHAADTVDVQAETSIRGGRA